MEFTANQLAELIGGSIEGASDVMVSGLSKIEEGKPGSVSFLSNPEYASFVYTSQASVIIVNQDFDPAETLPETLTLIRVPDARMAFAKLLEAYQQFKGSRTGIHPSAVIEETASLGEDVFIGAGVYIGFNTTIGNNTQIKAGATIGDNVSIGHHCLIHYNATVADDSEMGNHCTIQPNAVIGGDGFGFQPNSENNYAKIPHIGNVILEDHVEIGANTTIDRATLGSTIIRKGVKLDNLIQVAHNVEIDENTVIAAQSGIAGSVYVGKNCMLGGQVGLAGHQRIADGVKIAAQSGLQADVKEEDAIMQGSPALPVRDFQKSYVYFRKLPRIVAQLDELKKELNALKAINKQF